MWDMQMSKVKDTNFLQLLTWFVVIWAISLLFWSIINTTLLCIKLLIITDHINNGEKCCAKYYVPKLLACK